MSKALVFAFLTLFSFASLADVRVHGYGTLAATHADYDGNYDGWYNKEWDFEGGSQIALNISKELTSQFGANIQLISEGRDDYETRIRLAHVNWRPNENLLVRFGRIRLPFFLVSEYQEVGVLLPWTRLPEEVYFVPFSTMSGLTANYIVELSDDYQLDIEAYAGGGNHRAVTKSATIEGETKDTIGLNLHIKGRGSHLRLGYSRGDFFGAARFDSVIGTDATTGASIYGEAETELAIERGEYFSVGYKYDDSRYLLMGEYARVTYLDAGNWRLFGDSHYVTAGAYYGQFLFHATRAKFTETDTISYYGGQVSHAVGVNWIHSNELVFKIDYKAVDPVSDKGSPFTTYLVADTERTISILDLSLNFAF